MYLRLVLRTVLLSFTVATAATAATEREANRQYDSVARKAKADYDATRKSCIDRLARGNERDVCIGDAKSLRDKMLADAKAERKTSNAQGEARDDKMAANYRAAAQRCDALNGEAKDRCIADAKAKYKK